LTLTIPGIQVQLSFELEAPDSLRLLYQPRWSVSKSVTTGQLSNFRPYGWVSLMITA